MTDIYEQLRNANTVKDANLIHDEYYDQIEQQKDNLECVMNHLTERQSALYEAYLMALKRIDSFRVPIKESVLSPSAQLQIDSQYQECKLVGGCD